MSVTIRTGVLALGFLFGFAQTVQQRRQYLNLKRIHLVHDLPVVYSEHLDRDKDIQLSDEENLYNYLLYRYNRAIRPVSKTTESVDVNLTFSLMQIHGLNEKTQVFRTYGWLIVEWKDRRLVWKPSDYDNITEIVIDSTMLWTPELALINAVEWQFPEFGQYRAIVRHDGYIRWEPAGVFETSCKIDITFYPYDTQVCSLVFGTWTFTSKQVNLINSTAKILLDDYRTSGEWFIRRHKVNRLEFVYECCPDIRFSKVAFTLFLARRHRFFTLNLVLPCAMLSSLTLVTFLSPPDQGEKISLGISILLSFSVFLLSLSENMPKTSEKLPLFGIFTTFVMLMNTSSVMLTVLVLNLHHRNRSRPIPNWVRSVIFEGLARVLCMYSTEQAESSQSGSEPAYKYEDYRRNKAQRRRFKLRDGYSLASAAAQFRNNIKTTGLLPGRLPVSVITCQPDALPNDEVNNVRNRRPVVNDQPAPASTLLEENCKEEDSLLKAEYFLTCELQEWKRLAGIVDRLFFWLTFLSLIGVSAGMIGLMWAYEPLE